MCVLALTVDFVRIPRSNSVVAYEAYASWRSAEVTAAKRTYVRPRIPLHGAGPS